MDEPFWDEIDNSAAEEPFTVGQELTRKRVISRPIVREKNAAIKTIENLRSEVASLRGELTGANERAKEMANAALFMVRAFDAGQDGMHVLRLISNEQISAAKGAEWLREIAVGRPVQLPDYEVGPPSWREKAEAAEKRAEELAAALEHAYYEHTRSNGGPYDGLCRSCGNKWPCKDAIIKERIAKILARVRAKAKADAIAEIVDELRTDATPKNGEYIVVETAQGARLINEYADLYAERAEKYRRKAGEE